MLARRLPDLNLAVAICRKRMFNARAPQVIRLDQYQSG
jgi:hypothetical protein